MPSPCQSGRCKGHWLRQFPGGELLECQQSRLQFSSECWTNAERRDPARVCAALDGSGVVDEAVWGFDLWNARRTGSHGAVGGDDATGLDSLRARAGLESAGARAYRNAAAGAPGAAAARWKQRRVQRLRGRAGAETAGAATGRNGSCGWLNWRRQSKEPGTCRHYGLPFAADSSSFSIRTWPFEWNVPPVAVLASFMGLSGRKREISVTSPVDERVFST